MRITPLIILFSASLAITAYGQGLNNKNKNLPCLEKEFPVMIHLSVDSTDRKPFIDTMQILSLMEKVSTFFQPICMSFSACEINVIDNYTFHNIVDDRRFRELRILYGKPRRLNIFILGSIPDASCGYSELYGVNKENGEFIFLETDACDDSLEGQLAHHLGHYFGLQDTYRGDDPEIVNDPNCAVRGDSICDTPTDPFGIYLEIPGQYKDVLPELVDMSLFLKDCEFIHENLDPNGDYYQAQVGNIMSAYPCRCSFTNGQLLKMLENYKVANFKPY